MARGTGAGNRRLTCSRLALVNGGTFNVPTLSCAIIKTL